MTERTERLVLVTGGSGYVGSILVPLLAREFNVRVVETMHFGNPIADTPNVEFIQADILDAKAMQRAMKGITDVIHLAGIVTDELVDMNHVKAMRVNVLGTLNIVDAAWKMGARRFVYASSSSVYGTQDAICTEQTPPKPQTVYGATKLVGEDIVNRYSETMTVTSVRCATCCGPAPRMRLEPIVNIFSAQAYFAGVINVHGGGQYRTNVHVNDVAAFYRFLLDAPPYLINGQAFNLAADFDIALGLAERVRTVVEGDRVRAVRIFQDLTKHDARSYRIDASRLALALAWTPKHSIEDAIRDNCRWFREGHIKDWESDIYYNTRRMAEVMRVS